jgi:hypothetical protein
VVVRSSDLEGIEGVVAVTEIAAGVGDIYAASDAEGLIAR